MSFYLTFPPIVSRWRAHSFSCTTTPRGRSVWLAHSHMVRFSITQGQKRGCTKSPVQYLDPTVLLVFSLWEGNAGLQSTYKGNTWVTRRVLKNRKEWQRKKYGGGGLAPESCPFTSKNGMQAALTLQLLQNVYLLVWTWCLWDALDYISQNPQHDGWRRCEVYSTSGRLGNTDLNF